MSSALSGLLGAFQISLRPSHLFALRSLLSPSLGEPLQFFRLWLPPFSRVSVFRSRSHPLPLPAPALFSAVPPPPGPTLVGRSPTARNPIRRRSRPQPHPSRAPRGGEQGGAGRSGRRGRRGLWPARWAAGGPGGGRQRPRSVRPRSGREARGRSWRLGSAARPAQRGATGPAPCPKPRRTTLERGRPARAPLPPAPLPRRRGRAGRRSPGSAPAGKRFWRPPRAW